MKNLTPAKMTLLMFGIVGVLVLAYVFKTLFAVEHRPNVRVVPMALTTLKPGMKIRAEDIGMGPWPANQLHPDVFLSKEALVGRIVKEEIPPATPIRAGQLYPAGDFPPLQVEPGMRAVTVEVDNDVEAVGGLLKPGQYVDVHWTVKQVRNDPRLANGLTLTLFRGVRVLAIQKVESSQQALDSNATTRTKAVTLELTPEQANVLILARQKGTITMTYNPDGKGSGGVEVPDKDRATFYQILGMDPPKPPEKQQPSQPFRSEIYRKTSRQVLEFPKGEPSRVVYSSRAVPFETGAAGRVQNDYTRKAPADSNDRGAARRSADQPAPSNGSTTATPGKAEVERAFGPTT